MKMINNRVYAQSVLLTVIIIFTTVVGCVAQPNINKDNSVFNGGKAPGFILNSVKGNQFNSRDIKGKYLVIHFATTWCPFCNAEAPHLEKLYNEYKEKNVQVIIVDVKEDKQLVTDLLVKRFKLSFPVLLDMDGSVAASFAPQDVLPDLSRDEVMLASNLLIDPEGNIRFFSLLNSLNFDAKLIALKNTLDALL